MPAIDPVEAAHALMLDAARAIPARRVRSALAMNAGRVGLSDEQFDALAERVQHVIQTADITIEPGDAVSRAWLFWGADGSLADDAEYPEPVTREHAVAEYAADRDMPPAEAEPVPYEALPAIRALCEQARQDGRQITRDDLKEILP